MPTYTNPTGTQSGTSGDDTINITTVPSGYPAGIFDALGGVDSLLVQTTGNLGPVRFWVGDEYESGTLDLDLRFDPSFSFMYVYNVESVVLHGTTYDDNFRVDISPNILGRSVTMNGGDGVDTLVFFWANMTTALNFVVSGSTVASSFGSFSNFENFTVWGGSGNDVITTGGGDDQVMTVGGVDTVNTGAGNDYIDVRSSGGSVAAGDGDDTIALVTPGASVDGGAGQDYLSLSWQSFTTSINIVVGGGGTITSNVGTLANLERFFIQTGSGADTIATGAGEDNIYGGAGNDTLSGGAGNDWINGWEGDDTVNGEAGDDQLTGGRGNDIVTGGDGVDVITGDDAQMSFTGDGNDQLSGGAGNDTIYGGGGNDIINGGGDNDTLTGGLGADTVDGGDGNDWIFGLGEYGYGSVDDGVSDTLIGAAGNDNIDANYGDSVDGGTGVDTLYYSAFGSATGITANFATLTGGGTITIGGASLKGIEFVSGISGSNGNDVLVAGAAAGGGGISLDGWGGDDDLTGTSGVDSIYGGEGNDIIRGNGGINPDVYPAGDRLYGEDGNDTIYIGAQTGNASGGNGNDTIFGGASADELSGDAGNDTLSGAAGNDGLQGGDGDDLLTGGAGQDALIGGRGADTFRDTATGLNGDTIYDFIAGDKIIISNANFSTFSYNLTGNTLTYTGGSLTFGAEIAGHIVASVAAGGGVQLEIQLPPLATNDEIATYLTDDYWNGDTHRWNVSQGGTIKVDLTDLTVGEQNAARLALQQWSDISGIHFQEVTSGAQITFENDEEPGGPSAYTEAQWSNGFLSSALVHISSSWTDLWGSGPGSYGFHTYLHEIGHALGLGHSGNYNFDGSYPNDAAFLNDSWATTVMSYFSQRDNTYFYDQGFSEVNLVTPMAADILAIQQLYGLSTNTRSGDTVYGYNSNAGEVFDAEGYFSFGLTIFDTGGIDTLDYSQAGSSQKIDLNPETYSNVDSSWGNLTIARGTIIENAIGGMSIDVIIGNAANNVITGNGSADYFTGGAGNDTFRDTASNFSGDTITDFSIGDRIIITDATLAGFSFSIVGSELHLPGIYLNLTSPIIGNLVASAAAGGGVQLTLQAGPAPDAANDFNGDGRSDIMFRHDNGAITNFLGTANGGILNNGDNVYTVVSNTWSLAGTGDFNGDGRDDVLWRNASGAVFDFLGTANGGVVNNGGNSFLQLNAGWTVSGIGDFNGDGRDDILFRDANGVIFDYLGTASGGFTGNTNNLYTDIADAWHVSGVGDFNGDGRDDILFRNDNGAITNFLGTANGGILNNGDNIYTVVDNAWHVAGTGDFNGDGRDDILWRNDNGAVFTVLSTANGGIINNGDNSYAAMSNVWHVEAIGDYNGDGRDDILWRHDNGTIIDWLGTASGGFTDNSGNLYTSIALQWQVAPADPLI